MTDLLVRGGVFVTLAFLGLGLAPETFTGAFAPNPHWALLCLAAWASFGLPSSFGRGGAAVPSALASVAIAAPLLAFAARAGVRPSPGEIAAAGAILGSLAWLRASAGRAATSTLLVAIVSVLAMGPQRVMAWVMPKPITEASVPANGEWEIREVQVTVRGPLRRAEIAYAGYPPLVIDADLMAGETRTALAWMAVPKLRFGSSGDGLEVASVEPPDGPTDGTNRVERVVVVAPPGRAAALAELPPRPLPPLIAGASRPARGAALFAILVSAVVLLLAAPLAGPRRAGSVLSVPKRCFLLVLIGGSAAAVLGALAPAPLEALPGARSAVVIEGLRGTKGITWERVEHHVSPFVAPAGGEAGAASASEFRIQGGLLRTGLEWRGTSGRPKRRLVSRPAADDDGSVAGATPPVALVDPAFDPGLRLLRPAVNTFGHFASAWSRTADGLWTGHGSWPLGQPLPDPEMANFDDDPPAWCGSALPQGLSIFVGELTPKGAAGLAGAAPDESTYDEAGRLTDSAEPAVWVRLVGFAPE